MGSHRYKGYSVVGKSIRQNTRMSSRRRVILCISILFASLLPLLFPYSTYAATHFEGGIPSSSHSLHPQAANWSCIVESFAGKVGTSGLWGNGYAQCNAEMDTIDIQVVAIYCQPVLWGCLWFEQGTMGQGCTYVGANADTNAWCPPRKGAYQWSTPIDSGKLYGVRIRMNAYGIDGASAEGEADFQVQF